MTRRCPASLLNTSGCGLGYALASGLYQTVKPQTHTNTAHTCSLDCLYVTRTLRFYLFIFAPTMVFKRLYPPPLDGHFLFA